MCAQFLIRDNLVDFAKGFPAIIDQDLVFQERIFPRHQAPILLWDKESHQYKIEPMEYSLVPRWSKEGRPKFATYNARLETILDKPTWRNPFIENRCLVPMTGFIEWLEDENQKKFTANFSSDQELMLAAGIYDRWRDKEGTTIDSFAIITTEPTEFIINQGHDRMPVFPNHRQQKIWLQTQENDPIKIKHLLDEKEDLKFTCQPIETPKAKEKKPSPSKNSSVQLSLLDGFEEKD